MSIQSFRNSVHDLLRRAGWDVQRTATSEKLRLQRQLENELAKWYFAKRFALKTVLDIGANTGQFAELIRQVLPNVRILSFEPLSDCFQLLCNNRNIAAPFEAFQLALGNEAGESTINRNAFSPSSSLLPMESLHVEELPRSLEVQEERVKVERLDNLWARLAIELPYIVKVDVQGFEEQVILGGRETFSKATAVVLEVSCYPLYSGAPSFDRIFHLMKDLGFVYRGNVDQWKSRKDGRILQFDALFESADADNG